MSYYLWAGTGAIDDLEDEQPEGLAAALTLVVTRAEAEGCDLTLWYREGGPAVLVAAAFRSGAGVVMCWPGVPDYDGGLAVAREWFHRGGGGE